MSEKKGYIYILSNPAMPAIVKIGMTERSAKERADELSGTTGIPCKFEVAFERPVQDCEHAEKVIHEALKRHRVSSNREFFSLPSAEAIRLVDDCIDQELLSYEDENEVFSFDLDVAQFLIDTPLLFKGVISQFHRITPRLLKKYQHKWDWRSLSGNIAVTGNEQLLWDFRDHFDWKVLSRYIEIGRKTWMIDKYADYWDWDLLSTNPTIQWHFSSLNQHYDRIDWLAILRYGKFAMSIEEFVTHFSHVLEDEKLYYSGMPEGYVMWDGWTQLSENRNLSWDDRAIHTYADRWFLGADIKDGEGLSGNPTFPWSRTLIEEFKNRLYWRALSANHGDFWSESLIKEYEEYWDWGELACNPAPPWTTESLERFEDKLFKEYLGGFTVPGANPRLPWSEDLIDKYEQLWWWRGKYGLCNNTGIPWTEALLAKFFSKWEGDQYSWSCLSRNDNIQWTRSLLNKYTNLWDYAELSGNTGLPWDMDLLVSNISRFDQRRLAANRSVWKILSPHMSDDLLEYGARRI